MAKWKIFGLVGTTVLGETHEDEKNDEEEEEEDEECSTLASSKLGVSLSSSMFRP
jgi:hypothetical protein